MYVIHVFIYVVFILLYMYVKLTYMEYVIKEAPLSSHLGSNMLLLIQQRYGNCSHFATAARTAQKNRFMSANNASSRTFYIFVHFFAVPAKQRHIIKI